METNFSTRPSSTMPSVTFRCFIQMPLLGIFWIAFGLSDRNTNGIAIVRPKTAMQPVTTRQSPVCDA